MLPKPPKFYANQTLEFIVYTIYHPRRDIGINHVQDNNFNYKIATSHELNAIYRTSLRPITCKSRFPRATQCKIRKWEINKMMEAET